MSDTATATKKYKVIAKSGIRINKAHRQGDVVELTDAQAKYLVFNGKIELVDKASTKPAKPKQKD